MDMFATLTDQAGIDTPVESLRTGKPPVLEYGLYKARIKTAEGVVSRHGTKGVELTLLMPNKMEYKFSNWVTTRTGSNVDKNGKYMMGYNAVNSLCYVVAGKPLSQIKVEEKILEKYDFELRQNVPTECPVLTELTGKEVVVAIEKLVKNKQENDAALGQWFDVSPIEVVEYNEIEHYFRATDGQCSTEVRASATEARFVKQWKEKNCDLTPPKKARSGQKAQPHPSANGDGGFGTAPVPDNMVKQSLMAAAALNAPEGDSLSVAATQSPF